MFSAYRCAGILALTGALFVGFGFASMARPGPDLAVDAPVKSFGEARVGDGVSVDFVLTNRTEKPIRLVGSSKSCVLGGCVEAEGLPAVLAPGHSLRVPLQVKSLGRCDAYKGTVVVYSDCPSLRKIPLTLTGRVSQVGATHE